MSNKRAVKVSEFIAHGSNVTACTIGHKSSRIAATGGEDKKVNLWTLSKPTCIMSLTGHTSAVSSITFSSNEDKIVSGASSGALKVWDLEVSKQICNLLGHKSTVTCLEYHNYADYIASGSVDSQIRLWDLRRKGCIFTYKGHTNSINGLRFSPDSKWIASVSDDNLVKIWDLKAGKLLIDLKGHTGSVNSLEFHPNEFLLATGSSDRTVRFWDLERMESVSTSPQSPSAIKKILFEPHGKCCFAASLDYMQSVSWEPSECFDSVFCQWKQISDMAINGSKLTGATYNQNTVSFYMVDLLQVAPIGVPPVASEYEASPRTLVSNNQQQSNMKHNPIRKNFHKEDKLEASEEAPDNEDTQQNENGLMGNDNDQADICNQEEYNKIFKPQREIRRPASSNSISSMGGNPKKSTSVKTKKNAVSDKDQEPAVDKSYFVDIKVAPKPVQAQQLQPSQPAQPIAAQSPRAGHTTTREPGNVLPHLLPHSNSKHEVYNGINGHPVVNDSVSKSISQQQPQQKQSPRPIVNSSIDRLEEKVEKININDFMPTPEHQSKFDAIDFVQTIEVGHESFMRALKNRNKNITMIRQMWINGNIKAAMDHAVNMNDTALMADILNQLNQSVNIWNLDICTILLPSIKDLIGSKYEEHAQIGSDSCKIIFKNFGKLIKSSLMGPSIGVDLTREERQRKCNSCYGYLQDIINIIEKKMAMVSSQKLMNNFKEINLLMKTLES